MKERQLIFKGTCEVDDDGVPGIAYDQTKGDTPYKVEKLINKYAYLVTYRKDK